MYPEPLFYILGQPINFYALIGFLGCLLSLGLGIALTRRRDMPPAIVLDMWLIAIVAAVLGGELLPRLPAAFGGPRMGSWSLAGIVSVLCSLSIFSALHPATRLRPLEALDIAVVSMAPFHVLLRLGCFSAGCCHGKPAYGLPWAVTFTNPASASIYKGIPVHPTQLYHAAANLLIVILLLKLFKRPAFRGALMWVYLLAYGLLRFVIEFYRGDVRPMVGFLSLNQVVCLAFIFVGGTMLARRFLVRAGVERQEASFDREAVRSQ